MFDFNFIQQQHQRLRDHNLPFPQLAIDPSADALPTDTQLTEIQRTDAHRIDKHPADVHLTGVHFTDEHRNGEHPADALRNRDRLSFNLSTDMLPACGHMTDSFTADIAMTEAEANATFYRFKWPHGYRCPQCGHVHACVITSRRLPLYQCRACRHQTTLTTGTILAKSRLPLVKWATALRLLASPHGMRATQLADVLCVSYKTAFRMLKKLRQAISENDAQQLLQGHVHWGSASYGFNNGHHDVRHPQEHPVMVAGSFGHAFEPPMLRFIDYLQLQATGDIPLDLRHLDITNVRLSPDEPIPFAVKIRVIPPEHLGHKDLHLGSERTWVYGIIERTKSHVQKIKQFRYNKFGELSRMFRRAKQWINTTFHGIGRTYLQLYLDEFCFRYNTNVRGAPVFETLMSIIMHGRRAEARNLNLEV